MWDFRRKQQRERIKGHQGPTILQFV
jgi:hypothetical protein